MKKEIFTTRSSIILYFLIYSFSNVFASQFDIDRQKDKELTSSIKTASCCWRFWNIINKILLNSDIANLENTAISDAIFLKIDLNKYEHLKDLKNTISQQNFEEINTYFIKAINDTINNEDPSKMKFTVDTKSKRASFYEIDNSLVIKCYSLLVRPLLGIIQEH